MTVPIPGLRGDPAAPNERRHLTAYIVRLSDALLVVDRVRPALYPDDGLMGLGELTEAESWHRPAAEAGNTEAMNNLGVLLEERNLLSEGSQWHRRAATAGQTEAMENLARLLDADGAGTEAQMWLRRAAGATVYAPRIF
ncbi:hypothetical protein [Nocardia rhamnosiphila]|uniref:Uncharacterized protein n=2 Tax=Nocardia rhamnosiphila TaxID=426716 RepID=A0ABV2WNM1_9NOCA